MSIHYWLINQGKSFRSLHKRNVKKKKTNIWDTGFEISFTEEICSENRRQIKVINIRMISYYFTSSNTTSIIINNRSG